VARRVANRVTLPQFHKFLSHSIRKKYSVNDKNLH